MNIVRIEDKCDECMKCVQDCAASVWREVHGRPEPARPDLCNLCGHCMAVCPKDAVAHDRLDPAQVVAVKKKSIDAKSYREIVVSRRSIRHYKKKEVPREVIEELIDLARYSPTASNSQNVGYIVATDPALLRKVSKRIFGAGARFKKFFETSSGKTVMKAAGKIEFAKNLLKYIETFDYYKDQTAKGRDYILHNAPALIIIHAPSHASFACDNCNIAATNITNYAHAMGLGTCYIGFLTMSMRFDKALRNMLGIPSGRKVFASLVLGYPAISHPRTASRKPPEIAWIEEKS